MSQSSTLRVLELLQDGDSEAENLDRAASARTNGTIGSFLIRSRRQYCTSTIELLSPKKPVDELFRGVWITGTGFAGREATKFRTFRLFEGDFHQVVVD